jgi:hypothetical protein
VPESVDTQFFNPGTTLPLPAGNAYGVGTSVRRACAAVGCLQPVRGEELGGAVPLIALPVPARGVPCAVYCVPCAAACCLRALCCCLLPAVCGLLSAACGLLPAVCGRSLNDSCSLAELAVVHDAVLHGLV